MASMPIGLIEKLDPKSILIHTTKTCHTGSSDDANDVSVIGDSCSRRCSDDASDETVIGDSCSRRCSDDASDETFIGDSCSRRCSDDASDETVIGDSCYRVCHVFLDTPGLCDEESNTSTEALCVLTSIEAELRKIADDFSKLKIRSISIPLMHHYVISSGPRFDMPWTACGIVAGAVGVFCTTPRNAHQNENIYTPPLTTFYKQSKSYRIGRGKKNLHRCKEGLGRHALSLCPWRAYDSLQTAHHRY